MLKRLVEATLCGIGNNLLINLRRQPLHDHFWVDHAFFDPFPHQRNRLVHQCGECLHARDPVLVVLHGFKAQGVSQFVLGLYAAALVQWDQKTAKLVARNRHFIALFEQVIVELIGSGEAVTINGRNLLQYLLIVLVAPGILARLSSDQRSFHRRSPSSEANSGECSSR